MLPDQRRSEAPPRERRRPARSRRERRGRGLRGALTPTGVPLHRTRGERFDDLVLDAVAELEEHWAPEMADLEFAVDSVPTAADAAQAELAGADAIVDHGVLLGRIVREPTQPGVRPGAVLIVVYRRPIESRTPDADDHRADLVFTVVAELVADVLGRDVDEIDPLDW